MKKIGLIGAMDEEVAIIKEEMTNTNEVTKAGMTFVEGEQRPIFNYPRHF